jgi:hypothetical protein
VKACARSLLDFFGISHRIIAFGRGCPEASLNDKSHLTARPPARRFLFAPTCLPSFTPGGIG